MDCVQQREIAFRSRELFPGNQPCIKILGLFRYEWGNELIVISQNLNIVTVQYFQVHHSRKCFIMAKSNR